MPAVSKQSLFAEGVALAEEFRKAHKLPKVAIKNKYLRNNTGCYWFGQNRMQVDVESTAWLVNKPTTRRQSHPGWKTDRTAKGVVLHEFGHHVWYHANEQARYEWRVLHRKQHHRYTAVAEKVSGYEPCAEESFAESFRLFALNPMLLKAACPERYKLLTKRFKLKPLHRKRWSTVLPKAFHPRARAWVAAAKAR